MPDETNLLGERAYLTPPCPAPTVSGSAWLGPKIPTTKTMPTAPSTGNNLQPSLSWMGSISSACKWGLDGCRGGDVVELTLE